MAAARGQIATIGYGCQRECKGPRLCSVPHMTRINFYSKIWLVYNFSAFYGIIYFKYRNLRDCPSHSMSILRSCHANTWSQHCFLALCFHECKRKKMCVCVCVLWEMCVQNASWMKPPQPVKDFLNFLNVSLDQIWTISRAEMWCELSPDPIASSCDRCINVHMLCAHLYRIQRRLPWL